MGEQKRRRRGQTMTKEERQSAQDAFIKAMENTANVRAACMQAGISHAIVYQWQEHDVEFGIRFREANQQANWLLFGEAWRRAMTGEEEYVISMGKIVHAPDGTPLKVRKKSDRMLELLLKARLPEFREKQQVEHSGLIELLNAEHVSLVNDLEMLPDANPGQIEANAGNPKGDTVPSS